MNIGKYYNKNVKRLHVGCGKNILDGFVNVDMRIGFGVKKADVRFLKNYFRNVELVYACHVLEHFSHYETVSVLHDWYSVLCDGGICRISVPDFDKLIKKYKKSDLKSVERAIMGGQQYKYNFHHALFNHDKLVRCLKEAGFKKVREWDASEFNYSDFSLDNISLNLEAIK